MFYNQPPVHPVVQESALSPLFLVDYVPEASLIYDTHLFGSFHTNGRGEPVLCKDRRAIVRPKQVRTAEQLDTMLFPLLLASAKHARRYMVLPKGTYGYGHEELWRATAQAVTPHFRCEVMEKAIVYGPYVVFTTLPPEDVGRICVPEGDRFGAIVFNPSLVGVLKWRSQ